MLIRSMRHLNMIHNILFTGCDDLTNVFMEGIAQHRSGSLRKLNMQNCWNITEGDVTLFHSTYNSPIKVEINTKR